MSQTRTEQLLGSAGIGRLIVRLAVPSIIAQVINLLYNIVDRIYIGRIPQAGELAPAGSTGASRWSCPICRAARIF